MLDNINFVTELLSLLGRARAEGGVCYVMQLSISFCYVIIIISTVNYILGLINFVKFELSIPELSACVCMCMV